jgi:quercetin dioxygenase-like cupin family protein
MFTILEDEITLTFRGVTAVARAGETVNVPANAPHAFRNAAKATTLAPQYRTELLSPESVS